MPPKPNLPSIDDIAADEGLLAELDLETIGLLIEDAKARSQQCTKVSRALQGEVEHRLKDRISDAYLAKGEDTGTVHLIADGVAIEVTRPKKVEWDQTHMEATAERIRAAGDDPRQYVKIAYSVSEAAYQAWPDFIRNQFSPARMVVPGSTSVKLSTPKREAA